MELSWYSLFLLPMALGLLGFIEPCTIGGHLLFLDTQNNRSSREKIIAVAIFIAVRSSVAGMFGGLIAVLGQYLIGMQTYLWLIFGIIYLSIGIAFFLKKTGLIKRQIDLAPALWKQAQHPITLGLAFGLNIPACAAPILFGLLGLAATTGTALVGFVMMFLFGFFLSLPLVILAIIPSLAVKLNTLAIWLKHTGWVIGAIFVIFGLWSIWFGLYVDPANWAGDAGVAQ